MESRTPLEVHDPDRLRAVADVDLSAGRGDASFDDLAQAAAGLLDAPVGFVTLIGDGKVWYAGSAGVDPVSRATGGLELDDTFCKHVLASDRPLVVNDARTDPRLAGDGCVAATGLASWAGFPVRDVRGHVLGSFGVADIVARDWTATQVDALRVLARSASDQMQLRLALRAERKARGDAESAWVAAETARLALDGARRREHEVIDVLQRSLLPAHLPAVAGLETAVRFDASNEAADIGGDWYDVVAHGGGEATVIIGDVCGHDVPAIAVMAQVRHYLHVLALREPDLVAVLDELDGLMLERDFDRFATVALLRWRSEDRTLRFVSAGHPPPLLLRADGEAAYLLGGRRPPVNLGLARTTPAIGVEHLAPGDVVVLFTDGLFESITPDPEVGLDRLREVAMAAAGSAPDQIADALLSGLRPVGGWNDDVAIVVARAT